MTLDEYLTERNITAAAFANKIERAVSTVTRIRKGDQHPDSDTLQSIVYATGGAVTPNDFFDVSEPPAFVAEPPKPKRTKGVQ